MPRALRGASTMIDDPGIARVRRVEFTPGRADDPLVGTGLAEARPIGERLDGLDLDGRDARDGRLRKPNTSESRECD